MAKHYTKKLKTIRRKYAIMVAYNETILSTEDVINERVIQAEEEEAPINAIYRHIGEKVYKTLDELYDLPHRKRVEKRIETITGFQLEEFFEEAKERYGVTMAKLADEVPAPKRGLEKYPEFKQIVDSLANRICTEINEKATKIESEMPYKAQFVLEELIAELESRV